MKIHSYPLSIIGACLLALVSAPKVSSQDVDIISQEPTTGYPPEVVEIYMENCVSDAGQELESFCACTIETMQQIYTLGEFIQLGQTMQAGEEVPEEFNQIIVSCLTASEELESTLPD
ncbi:MULTISPECIES: hypothetical protein [unclassified Coleofasciculus]|uniref:hypothetical protein n=1 Tax=unclassified Coleofasciculus TaxID=2692782 RepID=UPI001882AFA4|nr:MULTISPECIES: hypothetical protein [unclassified Coleofasciculus]MBE9126358.1 hypothetical protein [Coleofasciculus sp. LEGE 07081]MBE9150011.1 hypothetical protein [Coleofasciculus sp. LEGE 07092]